MYNPIITVQTNQEGATFNIPATDPQSLPLNWLFSTGTQMGDATLNQPIGLTIASATGVVTFNTVGKAVGNLYCCSIRIRNGTNASAAVTTVDFIIQIIALATSPVFVSPTPSNGTIYYIPPGQNICFIAKAQDSDPSNSVVLTVAGAPAGAIFVPNLPTSALNPV